MKNLLLLLTFICATTQAQTYWDGTANKNFPGEGTEASPYLISTPEQLAGLAVRVNDDKETFEGKFLKMTADIYLTDLSQAETDRKEWTPIGGLFYGNYTEDELGQTTGPKIKDRTFSGTFDGNGHTIYNLYYNKGARWGEGFDPNDFDMAGWGSNLTDLDFSCWNKALFGQVTGGTIKNLNLSNAQVSAVSAVSLLVNFVREGSIISNCHVTGTTSGTGATGGGLVRSNDGLIENCTLHITSTGVQTKTERGLAFGGLTCENYEHGVIRGCTVTGTADNGSGFVVQNFGLIENCTASVDITCGYGLRAPNSGYGFVESNFGTIRNCVATGNLRGVGYLAGFCFENQGGRIESCYATGDLYNTPLEGVTSHAKMALFVYTNCIFAVGRTMTTGAGACINCFATGSCHVEDEDYYVNNASGFVSEYTSLQSVAKSRQANCYWNKDGLTHGTNKHSFRWAGTSLTVAEMQSQAFVDELNKMAALCGTSTWEYRPGQFPKATGVVATNIADYLGGGKGTKESPYLISNKEQLENFQWYVNRGYDFYGEYILQTADIALNAPFEQWGEQAPTKWTPIANRQTNEHFNETLVNGFGGHYDGGFHEVQNMYIKSTAVRDGGFFGTLTDGASVRNLGITDAYIRADNYIGILAASTYNWNEDITISQCWTSGDVKIESSTSGVNNSSAFINQETSLPVHILNCRSSAKGVFGAIDASQTDTRTSTTANYVFTGVAYTRSRAANHTFINVWYDKEVLAAGGITREDLGAATPQSTSYLQSREAVNQLNSFVTEWNQTHTGEDALNYWLWREGQYPVVSTDATYEPAVTITFQSNGGTEVAASKIEANSKIVPPVRPKRDGYYFVAWCTDEALSKPCTFENPFTESTTLYAKWIVNTTADYDLSLFDNEFASTFKIKTKQQLRGFAMAVNGVYDFSQVLQNSGSQPTTIRTPMDFTGKTVTLENDIMLNDTTDWQLWGNNVYAEPWLPIGTDLSDKYGFGAHPFTGTFDGKGHTISGLYVELNTLPSAMSGTWGLFGELGSGSIVKNLGIKASVINGQSYGDGTFRPAGYDKQHLSLPGLLAGKADNAIINQCFAQGKIIVAENNYTRYAGGMIAQVTGLNSTLTNCYAIVDIEGDDTYYCGLIGNNDGGTITNCYSAGSTYWGLSAGSSSYGSTTQSYYNQDLVVQPYGKGSGKTTSEMKQKATYEGWDFSEIWGINSSINDGYPFLRQFHPDFKEDAVLTTIPAAVTDLVYTGEAQALITAGVAEGGEVQYALAVDGEFSTTIPVGIDAGDYTVYYKVVADDNHNSLPIAGPINVTIQKAAMVASASGYTGTYDGLAHSITITIPEGATVKYGTAKDSYNLDASPTYNNVGSYTVYYQVTKANYITIKDSAAVAINKASLTITAGNCTKKQYDPMPEFTVSYDGFKNNETEAVLTKQVVISCGANTDSAPGEYDIVLSGAEATNYDIKYVAGKLTVNEPDSYTLLYMVDNQEYKRFTIQYREAITPLAAPEKEGYTFSGWSEIPKTMPAHDVTITGTFSINSYKLTYMMDEKVYKDTLYEYGATIVPEPIPAGNYLSFEWVGLPKTMPARDVTVYADYKVSGITDVMKPQETTVFSPNGKRLNKPQKGLNIIRMSNGKTKKVVVK